MAVVDFAAFMAVPGVLELLLLLYITDIHDTKESVNTQEKSNLAIC